MAVSQERFSSYPFKVHVTTEARPFCSIATPSFSYTPLATLSNRVNRRILQPGASFSNQAVSLNRSKVDQQVFQVHSQDDVAKRKEDSVSEKESRTANDLEADGKKGLSARRKTMNAESRSRTKRIRRPSSRSSSRSREPSNEIKPDASSRPPVCTMGELCEEDKEKIAKLLRQVLELTEENDRMAGELDKEKERAVHAEKKAEAGQEEAALLKKELETVSGKFTYSLSLLRAYQLRVREMQTALARSESAMSTLQVSRDISIRDSSPQRQIYIRNLLEKDADEGIRDVMDAIPMEKISCALGAKSTENGHATPASFLMPEMDPSAAMTYAKHDNGRRTHGTNLHGEKHTGSLIRNSEHPQNWLDGDQNGTKQTTPFPHAADESGGAHMRQHSSKIIETSNLQPIESRIAQEEHIPGSQQHTPAPKRPPPAPHTLSEAPEPRHASALNQGHDFGRSHNQTQAQAHSDFR
jgi:hypothetical protein